MRDGDGGEDEEGKKVKQSGRSGGAMVEQLIGSVHRLSVASLASMATADRKDEVCTVMDVRILVCVYRVYHIF